jgi:hypothetical protein
VQSQKAAQGFLGVEVKELHLSARLLQGNPHKECQRGFPDSPFSTYKGQRFHRGKRTYQESASLIKDVTESTKDFPT